MTQGVVCSASSTPQRESSAKILMARQIVTNKSIETKGTMTLIDIRVAKSLFEEATNLMYQQRYEHVNQILTDCAKMIGELARMSGLTDNIWQELYELDHQVFVKFLELIKIYKDMDQTDDCKKVLKNAIQLGEAVAFDQWDDVRELVELFND